jgi:hypothetical protein
MTASRAAGLAVACALAICTASAADEAALRLRATVAAAAAPAETLSIELQRWSTDVERAPLVTAAAALNRPPAPAAAPEAPAGGRAGRGGRGRGRGAAPVSPVARFNTAVKGAPTIGFIWGEGVSGYSIKYAWRTTNADGGERIVLVTDRRLGSHTLDWPGAGRADGAPPAAAGSTDPAAEADFTLIEIRLDGKGSGEGKTSLMTRVVVDEAAQTLALDGYAAAPALLKVSR